MTEEAAALDPLAAAVRGSLIRPADPEYDAGRALWNGMNDGRPAAILRCSGVADADTAFPHRDAMFSLGIWAGWEDPGNDAAARDWVRALHAALAPDATGGAYSNYLDRDDGTGAGAAYGENHRRLQEIRARFDPDGLIG